MRLRAERRMGELLRSQELSNGGRPKNQSSTNDQFSNGNQSNVDDQFPTLAQLGVTKDQSSQWQRLAAIPEESFEEAITDARFRVA
jgi:hypothetical protein